MTPTDELVRNDRKALVTENQSNTATDQTPDDGVYLHLVGQFALCAQANGDLELYAYTIVNGKVVVIQNSAMPFIRSTEGQTVLAFSEAHLVVEVDKDRLDNTLNTLLGQPSGLKVIVEGVQSSNFQNVMTSEPPPRPGTTPVKTNRL